MKTVPFTAVHSPRMIFDRGAIMRRAHYNWSLHKLQGWLGHRATFADALRKAWDAAKYEAWSVETGRTRSSRGLEATLETCEFLAVVAAPVALELREAA